MIEDVTPHAVRFLKNVFYVKDEQLTAGIVLDVLYSSKKIFCTKLIICTVIDSQDIVWEMCARKSKQ